MKILGILKNRSKKEDIIQTGNGSFVGIKDFLVANATHSLCKIEKSEGKLINVDKISSSDFINFINTFDKILTFGNTYNIFREYYNKYPEKFIFIEGPLYQRDPFKSLTSHNYFRVMLNTSLGNDYIKKYCNNHIRDCFNFVTKNIRGKEHILMINNDNTNDNAVDPTKPFFWIEETIKKIVKKNPKKVIIRLHPNQLQISEELVKKIEYETNHKVQISKKKYIEDDLKKASLAIMYSSGACVECLLSGIPVISTDPKSFCYELFPKNLDEFDSFNNIELPDINPLLSAISNTHFTIGEIISGEYWKILKNLK